MCVCRSPPQKNPSSLTPPTHPGAHHYYQTWVGPQPTGAGRELVPEHAAVVPQAGQVLVPGRCVLVAFPPSVPPLPRTRLATDQKIFGKLQRIGGVEGILCVV